MRTIGSFLKLLPGLLLAASPIPLRAQAPSLFQELGASYVMAASNNEELPSPNGVRVWARWSFADVWLARLSFHRLSDQVQEVGRVCSYYNPPVNCRMEPKETSGILTGFQGLVSRVVHGGSRERVAVGAGMSFTQLNAESVGESGLRADLLSPNTGQLGFLGHLSLSLLPLPRLPLLVEGGFTAHWVWFHTCSGETPPQYAPFCKGSLFREWEVGLSYLF